MSLTVGLDFGTHQTKVCVEDATYPAQKVYEFLEFSVDPSNFSLVLPSVVQINEDDTVSYGFVDRSRCKAMEHSASDEPELQLVPLPILELPKEPERPVTHRTSKEKRVVGLSLKDQLESLKKQMSSSDQHEGKLTRAEEESIRADKKYIESYKAWQREVERLKFLHERDLAACEARNNVLRARYERELSDWHGSREEKMYYRYFKLASFSNSGKWKHSISSDIISVWYLTYVIFTIRENYGENFFIQMGVPSGISHEIYEKRQNKALSLLISSYLLVELYGDKSNYLAESYLNLLEFTEIVSDFSDADLLKYRLDILPEAYAGLVALTHKQRIGNGVSLLVDIGGGTTDIAIFTIRNNQPDVHEVVSITKGLNYIFEDLIVSRPELTMDDVHLMFNDFNNHRESFNLSISRYYNEIEQEIRNSLTRLRSSFVERTDVHGLQATVLEEALSSRPIIFCGGGALFSQMRQPVLTFTDKKIVNKDLLNISGIMNRNVDNEIFTILATSFGLSIPLEEEIMLTPIHEVFDHIVKEKDSNSGNDYIHGLTDM